MDRQQNVLGEHVRLPACVLRDGAVERNIARFQLYAESRGVLLCPHAKTTMSPALFGGQLAAGCWGLTFATCAQLEVARRHGVPRVFYANQLVGAPDILYVCGGLAREADRREADVREFLGFLGLIAGELDGRGLFGPGEVLVSAGGSAFYDLVTESLTAVRLSRPHQVVLRSGCYLTQDHGIYAGLLEGIHRRSGSAEPDLEPALEVWTQVLSVPEPGLVILSAGRRDFGQEAGNPVALAHVRRGTAELRPLREAGWTMAAASDQHAHMTAPPGHAVTVGNLVALGPSHPCTTFDKWREIHLVDDDYNVIDTAETYF